MDDKSMDPTGVQCRLSSDKQKYVSQADMGPKKSHQKGCRLGLVNQSLVISDKSYIYIRVWSLFLKFSIMFSKNSRTSKHHNATY